MPLSPAVIYKLKARVRDINIRANRFTVTMAEAIDLQDGIIYGPVNSRRLGQSLGINLSPQDEKKCSFNCVYCQYGATEDKVLNYDEEEVPEVETVIKQLEEKLDELAAAGNTPDYITFSGNGEPTLHPSFPELADRVKEIGDSYSVDTALLSNASTLNKEQVQAAASKLDKPVMKLDVGNPSSFVRVNKPLVTYYELVSGLEDVEDLTLQSIKFRGQVNNYDWDLEDWIDVVKDLEPEEVQLYTLDRPTEHELEKVKKEELERVKERLERSEIRTTIS